MAETLKTLNQAEPSSPPSEPSPMEQNSAEPVPLYSETTPDYRIVQARDRLNTIYEAAHPAAKRLIEKKITEKPLGAGAAKTVYSYGDKKAVAFIHPDRQSPSVDKIKQGFYLNKLMHLLFPDNVPDIHLAGSQPEMTIREKVEPPKKALTKTAAVLKRPVAKNRLINKMHKMNIGLDTASPANFLTSEKGGVKYVDDFFFFPSEQLVAKINALDDAHRKKAIHYLTKAYPEVGALWAVDPSEKLVRPWQTTTGEEAPL